MYGYTPPTSTAKSYQVSRLKAAYPSISQLDSNKYGIGLKLQSGKILTVHVVLPPAFPSASPEIRIQERPVFHQWLDSSGRVVGSRSLNSWNQASDLGQVVKDVMTEFCDRPPTLYNPSGGMSSSAAPPSYQASGSPARTNGHQASQKNDLRVAIPPIPSDFPELNALDIDELRKLLDDDQAFRDFFENMAQVKTLTLLRDQMCLGNEEEAVKNLSHEEELTMLIAQVSSLQSRAAEAKSDFDVLAARQKDIMRRFEPSVLLPKLKDAVNQADEASEDAVSSFHEEDIDLDKFVKSFMQLRTLYHLRQAKADQLQKQLRQGTI